MLQAGKKHPLRNPHGSVGLVPVAKKPPLRKPHGSVGLVPVPPAEPPPLLRAIAKRKPGPPPPQRVLWSPLFEEKKEHSDSNEVIPVTTAEDPHVGGEHPAKKDKEQIGNKARSPK